MSSNIFIRKQKRIIVAVLFVGVVCLAQLLAFFLRFDMAVPSEYRKVMEVVIAVAVLVKVAVFYGGGLHHGWWLWTDSRDAVKIVIVNVCASVVFCGCMLAIFGRAFPRSVYLLDFVLCTAMIAALRIVARAAKELVARHDKETNRRNILIYGAGWAGCTLASEIRTNGLIRHRVMGFIDDSGDKQGEVVAGHRVLCSGRSIGDALERLKHRGVFIDEVVISMPSASGRQVREAVANCRAAGVACRILPGVTSLLQRQGLSGQIRDVSVEDLLGREAIQLDKRSISAKLKGKRVLVSGAAGSIGSVLCQQIAVFEPAVLVLLDKAESDLFRIDLELRDRFSEVKIIPEIADIRNEAEIGGIMQEHRINVVFHAAAYKHVPLMENHVLAAVYNNIIGTRNMAEAALRCGCESFVMISSDKAVNPTNVMGATKRAAELVVCSYNALLNTKTRFVSVRFGNVLGSSGSVVPTFKRQIANGGPVTVTHPEVRRYFMLTEEAVQLVLQASTMGNESEIFVLEMGELIKIADLAANMIRLAGLVPNEDIEIRYVGLRPGEKLYEEVISTGEQIVPTKHERIKIFLGEPVDAHAMRDWVERLCEVVKVRDEVAAVALLKELVPEYRLSDAWRLRLDGVTQAGHGSQ